jgi:hypothetical protein
MLCPSNARLKILAACVVVLVCAHAKAATKVHTISFGKWTTVQWLPEAATDRPVNLKVRPLLVDTRAKEFTFGPAHDVTDRLFVVRRAFRVNDSLPQESSAAQHWQWERGGWLLVDRTTGHISPINLPEFDVFYSAVSWYRDYAAYCGVSEDGNKVYAVVTQLNRRKPILKKLLEGVKTAGEENPEAGVESACSSPAWQRAPSRVTFEAAGTAKQTFAVRGHIVDVMPEEEDEEASK